VFICPLILGYHFVLEGQFLIDQHLRRMGRERYMQSRDEFYSFRKLTKFIWQFFSQENDITLSFGQPMDVMGNYVDAEGRSFDQYGNEIQLEEYFFAGGKVGKNLQRESEYTKRLGERIVERYFKDNIVLTSHLVAFAAFQIIKNKNNNLDLYGILRLPPDEYILSMETMREVVSQLKQHLIDLSESGGIKLSEQILFDVDDLIVDGIKRLGTYHIAKPLKFNKQGQIISESFRVLYFYHNRLTGYDLEQGVHWKQFDLEMV